MSSEVAISVKGLSKCYEIYATPRDRLKQFFLPRLQRGIAPLLQRFGWRPPSAYYREFWALRDLSLDVARGETVGIIGRNGTGKSTLLQMICGTLAPTHGTIELNGRVAALLELGSGFNPAFTGRENVYLNAAILGLPRNEVDRRFADIVAFADIGDFLDQPVKVYSSGMLVRLAFAVIAHVDADILIIDEALAVGDAFFQQKCMRFLRGFQSRRGTVLFVSHDTSAVLALCDRALLLTTNSSSIQRGDAATICRLYLENLYADPARTIVAGADRPEMPDGTRKGECFSGDDVTATVYNVSPFRPEAETFGHAGATIVAAGFLDADKRPLTTLKGDQHVCFYIRAKVHRAISWPAFGFMIKNHLGEYLFTEGTDASFRRHCLVLPPEDTVTATFTFVMPHLIRGTYLINVAMAEGVGDEHLQHCWKHDALQLDVVAGRLVHGYCGMNRLAMTIDVIRETERK